MDYPDIPSLVINYFNSDLYQTDEAFEKKVNDFILKSLPYHRKTKTRLSILPMPYSEKRTMIDSFLNGCTLGSSK
jgi:hypothetical protein